MEEEKISFPYNDEDGNVHDLEKIIKNIYSKIDDTTSQAIFMNRLLFSLTNEQRCMKNVIFNTVAGKSLINAINKKEDKQLYIYGAGIRGKRLVEMMPEKKWCGIIDRDKRGTYKEIPIISIEDVVCTSNVAVIISNRKGYEEIEKMLEQKGINKNNIIVLSYYDLQMQEDMYFEERCIGKKLNKYESFIDCGCYDGADTVRYIKKCNADDAKVFAFEPDRENFNTCSEKLSVYRNVMLKKVGLSDSKKIRCFSGGEGEMARLTESGMETIETDTLDDLLPYEKIGFIKADVEGEEEKLLRGAEKIIREQCPMLAISIYHKKSDIWRIPQLLLGLNPNYIFRLGHYTVSYVDTVLYALDG